MITVTRHAAERFIERIDASLTLEQAFARIETSAPTIEKAARFGAPAVIRGDGAKLILTGDIVVTVVDTKRFRRGRA